MSGVYFESKKIGDISCTQVKSGGVEVIVKQVGDRKVIKSQGRGNVRQVKDIARSFHKAIQ
ncbi:hypothetical protein QMT18_18255 [Cronobacter sakazakii]|nr:hypothetical protein [Cronobacter sakazakii]